MISPKKTWDDVSTSEVVNVIVCPDRELKLLEMGESQSCDKLKVWLVFRNACMHVSFQCGYL